MKPFQRQIRSRQLDLFQPAPRRMTWVGLPEEVRQKAKRLLIQLLSQHLHRPVWGDGREEVHHER
jgi:hypothetical protein